MATTIGACIGIMEKKMETAGIVGGCIRKIQALLLITRCSKTGGVHPDPVWLSKLIIIIHIIAVPLLLLLLLILFLFISPAKVGATLKRVKTTLSLNTFPCTAFMPPIKGLI